MRVFSTAKMSEKHQRDMRQRFPNVDFLFFNDISDLYQKVGQPFSGVDVLITYGEDLSDDMLVDFPDLKWIQVVSAGVERMPLDVLDRMGVTVTNARGIHGIPMGEYTLGTMLSIGRKSLELYVKQKQNEWDRTIRTDELFGKTVGILGFGSIGQEIAKRAKAFGMRILGVNSSGTHHPLADHMYTLQQLDLVLSESDYVVVVFPLTEQTQGIIDITKLEKMKPTAWLINIARGSVVNEEDLIDALKQKKIAGAALDVFELEPLPESNPLWKMDNVILTPHLSGRSPYYMERALDIFYRNMEVYISEQKYKQWINPISVEKGY